LDFHVIDSGIALVMTPERYKQIGEAYHAALDLAPAERASFLDRICAGDPGLRREVESLIASHERAGDFFVAPALAVAAEMLAKDGADDLIGQAVGRYQILSLVGAGGMGRVYLAEDRELGRRVALKFLPEYFTNDKSQVQRFRQEARAASALNHPNILTVYEVGQVNGTEFIAAEYVEGETLRALLTRGSLSVRESLDVATQVADALVAAHEAGIVHRDIKPENVMIRRDGYIKVLDFGLAKLTQRASSLRHADFEAPTIPAIKTNPGVIMGTAEYMSPEQARGLTVDTRTDVWSLGVVVYEMVSGRRPFTGTTHSDIVVSILEKQPVPLLRHIAHGPAELERIVTKAFAKETDERYQTVKDMAIDLRRLRRQLELSAELERSSPSDADSQTNQEEGERIATASTNVQSAARPSEPPQTQQTSSVEYVVTEIKRHKRAMFVFGVVAVFILIGAGYGGYRLLNTAKPRRPFEMTKVTRMTETGKARIAAISPDGKYLVYAEHDGRQQSLWVKQVVTGSTVQIVQAAEVGFFGLTFSNDSNYVYYVKNEKSTGSFNKLYKVPSLGGTSRKLLEQVDSAVAFSRDGQHLAFVRDNLKKEETQIVMANSDGGDERPIATRRVPERFASDLATRIAWSPDGKVIACAAGGTVPSSIVGVSVEDGTERPLTLRKWVYVGQIAWLFDGSGLLVIAAEQQSRVQVWHLSYPGGEVRQITNDLNRYDDVTLTADSGALVTVQTNRVSNIWVAPKDDASRAKQITSGTQYNGVSWTPDGRLVCWSRESGNSEIWIMNADGTNPKQLTHEGENGRPTVSRDGRYIYYQSSRSEQLNVWRMDIDGGNAKQLTNGTRNGNPYPSPDGQWVVYTSWDHGNGTIWKISIDGGEPVRLSEPTTNLPVVSPDGKQYACFYWDEQANPPRGALVAPFDGGPPTKRFNIGPHSGGFVLRWAPDAHSILFLGTGVSNVWSQPLDGGDLAQLTNFQGDQLFDFDYSADGKLLAVARGIVTNDVVMISDLR
jgi:serine/threonine protein kinase/Tol biopolymer transport system component